MSPTSCERLITHAGYSGVDGTNLRAPSCLSWADAQGMLSQYFCKRASGPNPRPWTREFDCLVPAPESAPASASTLPPPNDAPMPSNLFRPSAASGSISLRVTSAQPQQEAPVSSVQPAPWEQPFPRTQKRFGLGPASTALVAEARAQTHAGHYDVAAATIERALRIEPDNPLLWMELGQVRMDEGDAAQADGLEHKAIALATGDSQVQATAWRLIAESLRARGRNQEASEADRQAAILATR